MLKSTACGVTADSLLLLLQDVASYGSLWPPSLFSSTRSSWYENRNSSFNSTSAWLLFFNIIIIAGSDGAISFLNEPENTTVVAGEMAPFPCDCTGTKDEPHWKINGQDYNESVAVTYDLQLMTEKEGYTLNILEVEPWMDGTTVSCYLLVDGEEISSSIGILCVLTKGQLHFNTIVCYIPMGNSYLRAKRAHYNVLNQARLAIYWFFTFRSQAIK